MEIIQGDHQLGGVAPSCLFGPLHDGSLVTCKSRSFRILPCDQTVKETTETSTHGHHVVPSSVESFDGRTKYEVYVP